VIAARAEANSGNERTQSLRLETQGLNIVKLIFAHRHARSTRIFHAIILLLILALPAAKDAAAGEITVAAAADLTFAFHDVAERFQHQSGNAVKLSFGSSGNFFSEIRNGAPYDMFFSADVQYPQKLAAAGLIEPGTTYEYALGKIVVWVPNASKVDLHKGLAVLTDGAVHKIAIANPQHAPYGRAAVAALRHENLYDRVKDKIVMGEDISQTAQFVQSGNADVGIVALSLALAPAMKDTGRFIEIPSADYPPIIQAGVILNSSHQKELARQFLTFLKRPDTLEIMKKYGFAMPKQAAAGEP
jgi:molybdate transport system substrate-binding protein